MRIVVLTGGTSSERDVALASGLEIAAALRERDHAVDVVDLATGFVPREHEAALLPGGVGRAPPPLARLKELERGMLTAGLAEIPAVRSCDVVFLALHGGQGEDGTVQALLAVMGMAYTGSGVLGSALALDKDVAKHVLRDAGVRVAPWIMAPATEAQVAQDVGFPCIVKPSIEGSSVGLSLVREPAGLAAAVAEAERWDTNVMIEAFIPGRELTVGVLGDRALPVIEITEPDPAEIAGLARKVAELQAAQRAEQEQARAAGLQSAAAEQDAAQNARAAELAAELEKYRAIEASLGGRLKWALKGKKE